MKHLRHYIVLLAAFGLLMASLTPVSAGGPDHDEKSSKDSDREGSKQGQSFERRDSNSHKDSSKQESSNKRSSHKDDDHKQSSNNDDKSRGEKITICHRTHSATNPWVKITISTNGLNGHDHHDDIVPAPADGCPKPATPTAVSNQQSIDDDDKDHDKAVKLELEHGWWLWTQAINAWVKSTIEQAKAQQISHVFVTPESEVRFIESQPQVVFVNGQPHVIYVMRDQAPIILDLSQAPSAFVLDTQTSAMENLQPATAATMAMTIPNTLTAGAFAAPETGLTTTQFPAIPAATLGGLDIPIPTGTGTDAQQVSPADAGAGVAAADAAVGSFLSLSALALAVVFGSRWLTAKKR